MQYCNKVSYSSSTSRVTQPLSLPCDRDLKTLTHVATLFFSAHNPNNTSGLGVGIASGSLTQLGVLVDVVEIDPVVADYASKYFDWPTPNNLYIQDGRQFIKSAPEGKYDYVIHDVFTGGGVPPSLFSLEALQDIQRIMKPDGVLALVRVYYCFACQGEKSLWLTTD